MRKLVGGEGQLRFDFHKLSNAKARRIREARPGEEELVITQLPSICVRLAVARFPTAPLN